MKKLFFIIALAAALFCFAACGPADTQPKPGPEPEEPPQTVTASEETIVTLFNGSAVPQVMDSASCNIIEDSGKVIVIDAGWDVKETQEGITQFLRKKGYSKIDYLILTHAHSDHAGGMPYLIERFDIGAFYAKPCADWDMQNDPDAEKYYNAAITALQAKTNSDGSSPSVIEPKEEVTVVEIGESSRFTICYRQAVYDGDDSMKGSDGKIDYNHFSFGVKFESVHVKAYFGGDSSDYLDPVVIGNVGKCQIMVAPHHGTSGPYSSQSLLNEIAPSYVVVPGLNMNFGADTRARYEAIGAKIYTNEDYGTIILTAENGEISIKTEKNPNGQ